MVPRAWCLLARTLPLSLRPQAKGQLSEEVIYVDRRFVN